MRVYMWIFVDFFFSLLFISASLSRIQINEIG